MGFCVIRLGKDSVNEIKSLDSGIALSSFTFTCKQVERSIIAGDYAFIYLGSDNSKGTATKWKQGLRALGKITLKSGGQEFNAECNLTVEVISTFPESLDHYDFLKQVADLYACFSRYPVIGVKQSRNNAVQKVNEGEDEKSPALLTAIYQLYPKFKTDLEDRAIELLADLNFKSKYSMYSGDAKEKTEIKSEISGSNTIYYGAPGTGKSYSIDEKVGEDNCIKTVFHIETSNADFLGSIKPLTINDNKGMPKIVYDFVPGPFIRSFVNAINDDSNHHWLVIEEINRASAAAVFGEFFNS